MTSNIKKINDFEWSYTRRDTLGGWVRRASPGLLYHRIRAKRTHDSLSTLDEGAVFYSQSFEMFCGYKADSGVLAQRDVRLVRSLERADFCSRCLNQLSEKEAVLLDKNIRRFNEQVRVKIAVDAAFARLEQSRKSSSISHVR